MPTPLTTQNRNDIKGSPNGDEYDAIFDLRLKWPFWIGTGGRFPSESVAAFIGMRIKASRTGAAPVQQMGSTSELHKP